MIRKYLLTWLFVFGGIVGAAESVDTEIIRDLDFFMSLDVIQDDAMKGDGVLSADVDGVDVPGAPEGELK